jgi:hypothetical protein
MSIKGSIKVVCKTHNNREESYLIPEELVSHIAISLSCLVIFFDFTTIYIYIYIYKEIQTNNIQQFIVLF